MWARLGTLIFATALFAAAPAHAADEYYYCDEPDADVNCLDPALDPADAIGGGEIDPEVTEFDPNEPIDIADDGQFDGIYLCTVTDPGGRKAQAYASVNGHASGEMIFVLAGLDPNTDPYAGYGKGKFVDTTLTGTTHKGGAFSFEVAMGEDADGYAQATLSGTVRVKGRDLALAAIEYDVSVDCQSIW
ncbi:MAG: hypothetical protein A3G25_07730 [Betaproteobacteria bacterium RIFCSPLOWO2_12_FULL_63_13]|nr:MAG: hypothetical protein A3H32_10725 [Betaproteobacteria bacterium RIFCSPLOWO2_02_FULL_63_19]OGA43736.1 MAG: hypothetical protein A3G25_07730 [Betaproteobacteria bacterium RIFCSPLOWO2_12_FULL_63_13]